MLILFIGCIGFSQTLEEQKVIDNAMNRGDNLLKCIGLEEVLQKADQEQKKLELDKKSSNPLSPMPKAKSS